jgi:hypothetical protein
MSTRSSTWPLVHWVRLGLEFSCGSPIIHCPSLVVLPELIELVDETLKVLHEMLVTWSAATATAIGVRANVTLPPPPPPVEYMSPAWKLPIELPVLPPVSASVADKARFVQEAVTVLMIYLDEINAEGDDYIRQSRKAVLLRLEAVSTGAESWVREYERVARAAERKVRKVRDSRRSSRRDYEAEYERKSADAAEDDDDFCSCSECEEEERNANRRHGRGRGRDSRR